MTPPLYPAALGATFDTLPTALRAFHAGRIETHWQGRATVTRGSNPVARMVANLFGFARAGADQPVHVTVTPTAQGETWSRRIGHSRYRSSQHRAPLAGHVSERFGPVRVTLKLVWCPATGSLCLIPHHWSLLGLPLPRALLPSGDSFEHASDGRFNFDVTIRAPLIGLIVAYRGWLEPADAP